MLESEKLCPDKYSLIAFLMRHVSGMGADSFFLFKIKHFKQLSYIR